jgi:DNA polymerase III alpha subunit
MKASLISPWWRGIRFGLAAVKNVGMKAIESVIEEGTQEGPSRTSSICANGWMDRK